MRGFLQHVTLLCAVLAIPSHFVSTAFCDSLERPVPPAFDVRPWVLPQWLEQASEQEPAIPAREMSLAGTWGGFYTSGRDYYRIELKLTLDQDNLTVAKGPVRFYILAKSRDGKLEVEPRQSAEAIATYDSRTSTVELKIVNWAGSGYSATDTLQMDGVVSLNPDRIAGQCTRVKKRVELDRKAPSPETVGYGYVLARDSRDVQSLLEAATALANMSKDFLKTYDRRPIEPRTDPQIVDQLFGLDSELRANYPKLDPMNVQTQNLFPVTAHLFSDEIFEQHFGVKFDELDLWESKRIHDTFYYSAKGQSKELLARLKPVRYLSSYFDSSGSFNRSVVISHLLPRREVRRWAVQRMQRSRLLGFNVGADQEISRLRYQFEQKLEVLTRAEKDNAISELDAFANELAGSFLNRGVAELLTSKPDEMYFYSLESWRASSNFSSSTLDEKLFERLQEVVDSRIDNLMESTLQADIERISRIGDDYDAIEKVSAAYFDLLAVYRRHDSILNLTSRPSFKKALKYVTDLRRYLVSRHQDELIVRLQRTDSRDALSTFVASVFSVPESIEANVRDKVNQANEKQIAKIDREYWLAMFSEGERKLLDASGKIQVPAIPIPPTEDEIRRALARTAADVFGTMVGPYRYRHNIAALTILTRNCDFTEHDGMFVEYTVVELVKPVERIKDFPNLFKACFRCKTKVQMLKPIGEVPRTRSALLPSVSPQSDRQYERARSDATMRGLFDAVSGLASESWSGERTETFQLSNRGWHSPSITEQVVTSRAFAEEVFLRILIEQSKQ